MDSGKFFYIKNIFLIMLCFFSVSTYMILYPSGIDLIIDNTRNHLEKKINPDNTINSQYSVKFF